MANVVTLLQDDEKYPWPVKLSFVLTYRMNTNDILLLSIPLLLIAMILLAFKRPATVQKEVVYDVPRPYYSYNYPYYRPYVSPWYYSDWPYYYGPSWGGGGYSGGIRTGGGGHHGGGGHGGGGHGGGHGGGGHH